MQDHEDWRQAVQQCAACNTYVQIELGSCSKPGTTVATAAAQLQPKIASFASWLARHGPLVRSLDLNPWRTWVAATTAAPAVSNEAVQLLRTGMQAAAASATKPAAAADITAVTVARSAASQQQQQQQQLGLRLASFSSDATCAAGLLPLLPSHSLTRLVLDFGGGGSARAAAASEVAIAAVAAELPRLSSLQQLVFSGNPTWLMSLGLFNGGARVSDLAATALARGLKQLHTLDSRCCELGSMACLGAIAYLPQLRELWLMGTPGITPQGLMMLTRLSRLQCLGVDRNDEVTDAVVDEFWATLRSSNG
uniref:Uncharacterized protein n=1 Tax=Tetradesmus obliquus TaxID=3088 RepID=A0A383VV71_TETOB